MRVFLMVSRRVSVISVDLVLEKPQLLYKLSIMSFLVRVMVETSWLKGYGPLLEFLNDYSYFYFLVLSRVFGDVRVLLIVPISSCKKEFIQF